MNIYEILPRKNWKYTHFASSYGSFTKIDHIKEHKIKLYILKASVHDMLSDHNRNKSVGNDK